MRPLDDQKPLMTNCAGTSFINIIYTKSYTFPSREIPAIKGMICSNGFTAIISSIDYEAISVRNCQTGPTS